MESIVWVFVGLLSLGLGLAFRQLRARRRLLAAMSGNSVAAIVGRLARTSPAPAIEAGFRATVSSVHGHWDIGLSMRANTFEVWAWDGRTPRRATVLPLSAIDSIVETDAHGQDRLRASIRLDWSVKGVPTWLEFAPLNLRGIHPVYMSASERDRFVTSARRVARVSPPTA